jgi:hypothetical protein
LKPTILDRKKMERISNRNEEIRRAWETIEWNEEKSSTNNSRF